VSTPSEALFLSYASEDSEAANQIAGALRDAGFEVWFDQSELRGGDAWDRKIRREIRDCALFIPIISCAAKTRAEGYFRLEWRLADQRTHLMAKGRVFILPVCIDDTTAAGADVPDSFSDAQWVRIAGGEVSGSLIQRVQQLIAVNGGMTIPAGSVATAPEAPRDATAFLTGRAPEKSIAVLPFTNLGEGADGSTYFSDGLAEEILNALSQVEELKVAARSSSFSFRAKAAEVSEIARRLRVAHVLEGSVRRAGDRLRVTVQLIDARNGFQLWSERYDREMADVFEIQDEIARSIAERLRVTFSANARRRTSNVETYELYLQGLHYWHERAPATLRMAIKCFEQAISLESDYPLPYASLSNCYAILNFYGWLPDSIGQPIANAAIIKAMALDESLWECNLAKGLYILYFERNWRSAEAPLRRAIALNPRSSLASVYYGWYLSLAARKQEAVEVLERACELDPLAPLIRGITAGGLCLLGQFDTAEHAALRAVELQPDYVQALWWLGMALLGQRRYDEALRRIERLVALSRAPLFVGVLGMGYGFAGRSVEAQQLLGELTDRGTRGENIPTCASLAIQLGLRDLTAVRAGLQGLRAQPAQQTAVRGILGPFLGEPRKMDSEIDRACFELFGW
jgi:TolB-like protein